MSDVKFFTYSSKNYRGRRWFVLGFSYEHEEAIEQYLFSRGESYKSYTYFGAHLEERHGNKVTHFRVYAPKASGIFLVGGFNDWQNDLPMKRIHNTSIWTITLNRNVLGYSYKYAVVSGDGHFTYKSDPYAFLSEYRPHTASVVWDLNSYPWADEEFIRLREATDHQKQPMIIYELHLGSWRSSHDKPFLNYREIANQLVPYLVNYGFSHVEILPVMEHPLDASWGYQVTGFFSATSRYGKPEDLMYFIDLCHKKGIGVILDWVPCHFCKDAHGLSYFDGENLYESAYKNVADNIQWGTTNFDLTRFEVWSFLISNALFWCDYYHIDGIRVDAVAFMIYLDHGQHEKKLNRYGDNKNVEGVHFIRQLNRVLKEKFKGVVVIAEESTDFPQITGDIHSGGLGFDYKWNMGWMNDTLKFFSYNSEERKKNYNLLTFSMTYAYSENFVLPLSHDEVVHGKMSLIGRMSGDYWQKFANLRLLLLYQMTHPGKKLLFMGTEIPQFIEWDEKRALDWFLLDYPLHNQFHGFLKNLIWFYRNCESLYYFDHDHKGFEWIECDNSNDCVLIYQRMGMNSKDDVIVVLNLTSIAYECYRIGVPENDSYEEVFNSDARCYGGSGVTNAGIFKSEMMPWNRTNFSIQLRVPPLGGIILKKKR